MRLVIVESPNKVKAIQTYLEEASPGPWRVIATVGHWRGLPPMRGQAPGEVFDIAGGSFAEHFEVHKADIEARLAAAIRSAQVVYLASDPDREGEAIAWHVAAHFKLRAARRLEFHAITHDGIARGLAGERELDRGLAEAQRARAALDYLVGMEVSRRLWRFGAKSAGRVQSCALRILATRERAIGDFVAKDFVTVRVDYREGFTAVLGELRQGGADENGEELPERVEPKKFDGREAPHDVIRALKNATHTVRRIESTTVSRKPPPPFTTAALLGEASALGTSPEKVTAAAQALFEKGLVTYIRTDSVALAPEAVAMIRDYLANNHPKLLPPTEVKRSEGAHAQGAHEAIRPTAMDLRTPPEISGLELNLYEHIWLRTLASQASPAVSDRTIVHIAATSGHALVAHGTVPRERGYLELLRDDASDDDVNARLPLLRETQVVHPERVHGKAETTKPPPRFSVKTLIRYLERKGIGRPSTYNTLISTLFKRGYVAERKAFLVPEPHGLVCDELMRVGFDQIAQEQFTAVTERSLDKIASGSLRREVFLRGFWAGLEGLLANSATAFDAFADAHPDLDRSRETPHESPCPACGGAMLRRRGPSGAYAKCTACAKTLDLNLPVVATQPCPSCGGVVHEKRYRKDGKAKRLFVCASCAWRSSEGPPKVAAKPCPTCNAALWARGKKDDRFWGCSRYPDCRGRLPWDAAKAKRAARKPAQS